MFTCDFDSLRDNVTYYVAGLLTSDMFAHGVHLNNADTDLSSLFNANSWIFQNSKTERTDSTFESFELSKYCMIKIYLRAFKNN